MLSTFKINSRPPKYNAIIINIIKETNNRKDKPPDCSSNARCSGSLSFFPFGFLILDISQSPSIMSPLRGSVISCLFVFPCLISESPLYQDYHVMHPRLIHPILLKYLYCSSNQLCLWLFLK